MKKEYNNFLGYSRLDDCPIYKNENFVFKFTEDKNIIEIKSIDEHMYGLRKKFKIFLGYWIYYEKTI